MIKLIRIDDRLIHGQVALVWSKYLEVDRIIVVNEGAAKNPTIKATLKMAAPEDVKVAVLSVEKGLEILRDERSQSLKILVVVDNPKDAAVLVKNIEHANKVNFGNYGKLSSCEDKKKINNNVFLTSDDKNLIAEMAENGAEVFYQLLPGNEKIDLSI